MLNLTIILPASRNGLGTLSLSREDGQVLLGDIAVAGTSSSVLASQHNNPNRDVISLYGHTPTGTFRLSGIYASGDGTRLPARHYGPNGIIALEAVSGQALLANSAGRGILLIHGGPMGPNNSLRSTAGALRVSNADMNKLCDLIGSATELSCLCLEDDGMSTPCVFDDPLCRLTERVDPALMIVRTAVQSGILSRRNVIRGATASFIMPISFVAATPEIAAAQSY